MNSTTKDSSVEPKPVDFITRVASENGGPFTKRAYLGDDGGIVEGPVAAGANCEPQGRG